MVTKRTGGENKVTDRQTRRHCPQTSYVITKYQKKKKYLIRRARNWLIEFRAMLNNAGLQLDITCNRNVVLRGGYIDTIERLIVFSQCIETSYQLY